MDLDVLICTINDGIHKIIENIYPKHPKIHYIVSHQVTNQKKYLVEKKKLENEHFVYDRIYSKGLSKNRNNALHLAENEICLIADDDVVYKKEQLLKILRVFKLFPKTTAITFKIESFNAEEVFKTYPNFAYYRDKLTLFGTSSIEIAFRRSDIEESGIEFNEMFGLGTVFISGEETLFLNEILNRHKKILFLPIKIGKHPYERTTTRKWSCEGQIKRVITYGAIYSVIFPYCSMLLNLISAIRNYKKLKTNLSWGEYFNLMNTGKKLLQKHKVLNNYQKINWVKNLKTINWNYFIKKIIEKVNVNE